MTITLNSTVKRIEKDVAATKFENNVVLLHIENGEYYNFNNTGSDLWEWISEETEVSQLVAKITDKYDCSSEIAIKDVLTWLDDIYSKNLLEVN